MLALLFLLQVAQAADSQLPDGFSVGLGAGVAGSVSGAALGGQSASGISVGSVASIRLRTAGGLVIEPLVTVTRSDAEATVDAGDAGKVSADLSEEVTGVGLAVMPRLATSKKSELLLNLELSHAYARATVSYDEGPDQDAQSSQQAFAAGFAIQRWFDPTMALSANCTLLGVARVGEFADDGATESDTSGMAVAIAPTTRLMFHLYW